MAIPRDPGLPNYQDRFVGRALDQWVKDRFRGNVASAAAYIGVGRDILGSWISGATLPSEKHWPKLRKTRLDIDELRRLERVFAPEAPSSSRPGRPAAGKRWAGSAIGG